MTIRQMLDMLLAMSVGSGEIRIEVDPDLLRPADVTLQVPCCDKFKDATGWEPEIPYSQTLGDMLNYWRDRVARGLD